MLYNNRHLLFFDDISILLSVPPNYTFLQFHINLIREKCDFNKLEKKKIVNILLFFASIFLNDSHDHNQSNMPDNIISSSRLPSLRIHPIVTSHEFLNVHLKILKIFKTQKSKMFETSRIQEFENSKFRERSSLRFDVPRKLSMLTQKYPSRIHLPYFKNKNSFSREVISVLIQFQFKHSFPNLTQLRENVNGFHDMIFYYE